MKYKKYQKKFNHTYVLGITPIIDLLKFKPRFAQIIYLSKNLDRKLADEIISLCRENNVSFEFSEAVFEKLAYKDNTYAIAVIDKYKSSLNLESNHLVLVNPSNMGNLGTIIRTCIAFNITNIALIRPACDIFDPKVISSSMGSFFNINFEYFDSFEDYRSKISRSQPVHISQGGLEPAEVPFRSFYSFMLDGENDLNNVTFNSPFTLIFGNEGEGLDNWYLKNTKSVYIKHSELVDSLNLSIAVGIVLDKTYQ